MDDFKGLSAVSALRREPRWIAHASAHRSSMALRPALGTHCLLPAACSAQRGIPQKVEEGTKRHSDLAARYLPVSRRKIWSILGVSCEADSWWFSYVGRSVTSLQGRVYKRTKIKKICVNRVLYISGTENTLIGVNF